jgi:hypothetical protein
MIVVKSPLRSPPKSRLPERFCPYLLKLRIRTHRSKCKSFGVLSPAFAFVFSRIVQTGEEPVKVALRLASLDL